MTPDGPYVEKVTKILGQAWGTFLEGYFFYCFDKKKNKVELRDSIMAKYPLIASKTKGSVLKVLMDQCDKAISLKY